MATQHQSISQWIAGLKQGEQEAAQRLWARYARRLTELTRQRLAPVPSRVVDEDDIAQNVFLSLCMAAEAGRLQDVRNRDDLWWVLMALVRRKIADHVRSELSLKRGAGKVQAASTLSADTDNSCIFTFEQLANVQPTPEYVVAMEEQLQFLMARLRNEQLRRIAVMRIEGYSIPEIAAALDVATKTINRKLRLIRAAWWEAFFHASAD